MSHKMFVVIFVATILHLNFAYLSEQPEYSASILLSLPGLIEVHLCNGAIIHEKVVVTPANCLHIAFINNGKLSLLDASVLTVVAGSANAETNDLRMNVSSIEIPKNFNYTTLDNDIALLILGVSLPLGTRPDIRWIIIDDGRHTNKSCMVNFFSRNTKSAIPEYYQTEQVTLQIDNSKCRNSTNYPAARKHDICSLYIPPQQLDCEDADSFLKYSNDRGTGLVCESYLVGLLSSVVTKPNPENNCSDVTLDAMYTNLFPHIHWIYSILTDIKTERISAPYDFILNSLRLSSSSNSRPLNSTISYDSIGRPSFSTKNSTITNSTTRLNSTLTNLTAPHLPPYFIGWNVTTPNTTVHNQTHHTTELNPTITNSSWHYPINHFAILPNNQNIIPTPAIESTDRQPPTFRNFFRNDATLDKISAGCLLISVVSFRLNIFYL